ncbi:hypothetical protein OSB04_031597 [Centaurea solstitialis]|uniref:Uncharacterized protein n=1 Tax=Centaurea solstitialis TaxID=347529 RepID=A0AA38W656_9ASTR|nr:hypothetical protein OSB04_031597 [Centaurea solstitialis]
MSNGSEKTKVGANLIGASNDEDGVVDAIYMVKYNENSNFIENLLTDCPQKKMLSVAIVALLLSSSSCFFFLFAVLGTKMLIISPLRYSQHNLPHMTSNNTTPKEYTSDSFDRKPVSKYKGSQTYQQHWRQDMYVVDWLDQLLRAQNQKLWHSIPHRECEKVWKPVSRDACIENNI